LKTVYIFLSLFVKQLNNKTNKQLNNRTIKFGGCVVFKQLKSERLSERVANQIIKLIETGELKPGDKLPAEDIFAEKLGVSRGILREALALLQFQGLISRKPKDGTYIRELPQHEYINESIVSSLKDATYRELIEIRESLEQRIVELAIERASNEEIEIIQDYLNRIVIDENSYQTADHNFHLKVAELSKNVLLINFIDSYYGLIEEFGQRSNRNKERRLEVIEEHKTIINSIMKRDIEAARAAVAHHLRRIKQVYTK
jgi:GntR family transcriptional repressor for pyruvate dehydrogenase complex